jgi:hypothetical protein
MMKPIMEYLVPRQKAGVFADLAWRIIEQNPNTPLDDLAPQFRQAWNRVDARLGQVRYNRLFINNEAKNFVQAAIRAPGWSGGTIAELGGAFVDAERFFKEWAKTGKPPQDLPDRTAYAISLLLTVTLLNALLTYLFTGEQPKGMDYFAFRDGGTDDSGHPTRLLLPTYMKDVLAYAEHPFETLKNKSHPMLALLREAYENQDFYGTEIRHPGDSKLKQTFATGKYAVKQFIPFWIRGAAKVKQRGGGLTEQALPYVGIMPAPTYLYKTEAEKTLDQRIQGRMPKGSRTQEQTDKSTWRRDVVKTWRTDPAKAQQMIDQRQAEGKLTKADEASIKQRENRPMNLAGRLTGSGITAEDAVATYQAATPSEKDLIREIVRKKINGSRSHTQEQKQEFLSQIGEPVDESTIFTE